MIYGKELKKMISLLVIGAFLFQFNIPLHAQSEDEIVKQFRKARETYLNGQYIDTRNRIERIIGIVDEKKIDRKDILGECYLLLGAIYEKEGKPILAEENYRKARDIYGVISVAGVDLDPLEIYRRIIKGGVIEESGQPRGKKKFPWLLVVGGVVVVGVVAYFLFLRPQKKYQLVVDVGDGVAGSPGSGIYEHKKDSTVTYNYTADTGYSQLAVELDGREIDPAGSFTVTGNHNLKARAQENDVRIITDASEVKIPENGSAVFQVWLSAQPVRDIVVTVEKISGDPDISINPADTNLTFNPDNWEEPQEVELRAARDGDTGNGDATIRLSSADIVSEKTVVAVEIDNSTLALVVSPTFISVPELGTEDFQVKLSAKPNAAVTVTTTRQNGDPHLYVKSGSPLIFNPDNYNNSQNVVLGGSNDADAENGKADFLVSASEAGIASVTVRAEEIDKDGLNFKTDTNRVLVTEGGTAQFNVKLTAQPGSDVTAAVSRVSGDTDITVENGTLTFTAENWDTGQTVTLAAARDNDDIDGTADIGISADDIETKYISAEEVDNYSPGFVTDKNELTIVEGQTGQFQVKLSDQPLADVTANITISGDPDIQLQSQPTLTFTTTGWDTGQTVTLAAAIDEDEFDGQAVVTIAADGLPSKQVTVNEHDIDGDPEPLVKIDAPANGDRIDNDVTIRGKASDPQGGIERIELYIDDLPVQTFNSDTFEYTWVTVDVSPGDHKIKAIAYDTVAQTDIHEITVTVEDALPTVEIIPPEVSPLSGTVTITVNAEDYRGVQTIRVFIDDVEFTLWDEGPLSPVTFNFDLDTTLYENGDYTLKAIAVDTAAQESEPSEITITITN